MNQKTVFTFLLGVLTTMLVFGVFMLLSPKSASQSQPVQTVQVAVPLAATIPATTKSAQLTETALAPETVEAPQAKPEEPGLLASSETPLFKALFSKEPDSHSLIHEVKPGENLTVISKKYGVTVGVIKKINGFSDDRIVPAQKLKIPTYKFSLVVDKSQNTLILKGDEELLKTYHVSTGEKNSTPVGVFKVTDKLLNPTWYKAGAVVPSGSAENVLGTRWIGISQKGYGIHGTTEPDKIGQQVTAGCVRMRNEEVEELYEVVPSGAEVIVVD